ncbi:MAG: transcription antitermination factor NusB [Candidatus Omnitrophota bacterium]
MRKRTKSREFALQILYQLDITRDSDIDAVIMFFWQRLPDEDIALEVKDFTQGLVKGVIGHLAEIDKKISGLATNWRLDRMAKVDRNIMRLAAYEIIYCQDIPSKVSINEAVELAKKYSDVQAAKFVNGILDKIKSDIKK